ncbi:hypothetical protein EGW08_005313, partial [Elysia chlorotica]
MRMRVCLPGHASSHTATVLLLIACLSYLLESVVSQTCEDKCRNTFNYYNSFLQSPVLVQYYYQSCLSRCYVPVGGNQVYPGSQIWPTPPASTAAPLPWWQQIYQQNPQPQQPTWQQPQQQPQQPTWQQPQQPQQPTWQQPQQYIQPQLQPQQ